jgi:putative ABC transport system permease protein
VSHHWIKTTILVASITLILFLPLGIRVLIEQSAQHLTARAEATPLLVGTRGSPLELVLNSLYFGTESPATLSYSNVDALDFMGLALPIPIYTRFRAQSYPIVGTSLDYFAFRDLDVSRGEMFAILGECVLGSRVAELLGVGPGDAVISSPESVFDIAGVYPLKMRVAGVLAFSDSPDDEAIFVDLKTAWVIGGFGHGHQDLDDPSAVSGVLRRDSVSITANAAVVQYNEITKDNIGSFHFHGDVGAFPVSAVIAVPPDQRSSTILRGRFEESSGVAQIVVPGDVMEELLSTVLTVQTFVLAAVVIVGVGTLATVGLVFGLSLRLRKRELMTMTKIGASPASLRWLVVSEMVVVSATGVALAFLLTAITAAFGPSVIRAVFL